MCITCRLSNYHSLLDHGILEVASKSVIEESMDLGPSNATYIYKYMRRWPKVSRDTLIFIFFGALVEISTQWQTGVSVCEAERGP